MEVRLNYEPVAFERGDKVYYIDIDVYNHTNSTIKQAQLDTLYIDVTCGIYMYKLLIDADRVEYTNEYKVFLTQEEANKYLIENVYERTDVERFKL